MKPTRCSDVPTSLISRRSSPNPVCFPSLFHSLIPYGWETDRRPVTWIAYSRLVSTADDVDAAYRLQLEESLPLPLPLDLDLDLHIPSPLAFADHHDQDHDEEDLEHLQRHQEPRPEDMPPPPQELLDGLKEVRDENANHVVLLEPLDAVLEPVLEPPSSSRFLCQPHIMRHAIKGVF